MTTPFRIDYKLTGIGWSECTIIAGESRVEVTASYLSDALSDLVLSGVAAISFFRCVEFGFLEEPGEFRWRLDLKPDWKVRLRISQFDGYGHLEPIESGVQRLDVVVELRTYAAAVHACATAVLAEHGLEGYAEKWHLFPFPSQALQLLQAAIASFDADD